jgi:hypothetical protein
MTTSILQPGKPNFAGRDWWANSGAERGRTVGSVRRPGYASLTGRDCGHFSHPGNPVSLPELRGGAERLSLFERNQGVSGKWDTEPVCIVLRLTRYKERFEAIGWTKTQVIARGLNRENVKQRLELAETNSTRILQPLIKGEPPPSEVRRVVLYFTGENYEMFEKALLQNGGSIGPRKNLVGREMALMALIKNAALSK